MSTVTFDTGAGIARLREQGFTAEQAEAIIQTLREAQAELATKADLRDLEKDLKLWMGKVMAAWAAVIIGAMAVLKVFA